MTGRDWVTYAAAGTSIIHQRRIHLRQIAGPACALNVGYSIMNIYTIYISHVRRHLLGVASPCPALPRTALHSRCSSPLGRPRRDLPMPNGEQQSAGQESSRRGYSQSEEGGGAGAGGDHLLPPGNFKFIIAFAVIYDLCEISSYIKVNGVT